MQTSIRKLFDPFRDEMEILLHEIISQVAIMSHLTLWEHTLISVDKVGDNYTILSLFEVEDLEDGSQKGVHIVTRIVVTTSEIVEMFKDDKCYTTYKDHIESMEENYYFVNPLLIY